jgi:hypothetical protein
MFYLASHKLPNLLLFLIGWIGIYSFLALNNFFSDFLASPPRFPFLIGPALVTIAFLFSTPKTRNWLDSFDLKKLTLIHLVRVPVEVVLFLLFREGAVPEVMTFDGWNWDIVSGLSALPVYYFVLVRKSLSPTFLLAWNFICLALLLNIVIIAILSAPTPFQKLAFEQPNIAVAHFPFVLLPALVVPLVLLSHLIAIWKLTSKAKFTL